MNGMCLLKSLTQIKETWRRSERQLCHGLRGLPGNHPSAGEGGASSKVLEIAKSSCDTPRVVPSYLWGVVPSLLPWKDTQSQMADPTKVTSKRGFPWLWESAVCRAQANRIRSGLRIQSPALALECSVVGGGGAVHFAQPSLCVLVYRIGGSCHMCPVELQAYRNNGCQVLSMASDTGRC